MLRLVTVALSAPPEFQAFNPETTDPRDLATWCSESEPIARVLGLSSPDTKIFQAFQAIYVISPEDVPVAKVGVAVDPLQRLAQLQGGYWGKLYIRSLFWCSTDAFQLERAVLRKLNEFDARLVGEWGAIEAEDMAMLVAKCVGETKSLVASSDIFLESWVHRGAFEAAKSLMYLRPKQVERRRASAKMPRPA